MPRYIRSPFSSIPETEPASVFTIPVYGFVWVHPARNENPMRTRQITRTHLVTLLIFIRLHPLYSPIRRAGFRLVMLIFREYCPPVSSAVLRQRVCENMTQQCFNASYFTIILKTTLRFQQIVSSLAIATSFSDEKSPHINNEPGCSHSRMKKFPR